MVFTCDDCGKETRTYDGLRKHRRSCRGQNNGFFSPPLEHQGGLQSSNTSNQPVNQQTINNFVRNVNRNSIQATGNATNTQNNRNNNSNNNNNHFNDEFTEDEISNNFPPLQTNAPVNTTPTTNRNRNIVVPTTIKWITECISAATKVATSGVISPIIHDCPDKHTILTEVFGFAKTETLMRVNDYVGQLRNSHLPQNEALDNFKKALSPPLQPLVKDLKRAFLKGIRNHSEAVKRAANSTTTTDSQQPSHHGNNRLTRAIKELQACMHLSALEADVQSLDTEIDKTHKLIADSINKRRVTAPATDLQVAVKESTLPILLQVEALIQGQINASRLFEDFISVVDASLIIGMLQSTTRQTPTTTPSTSTTTSTDASSSSTENVEMQAAGEIPTEEPINAASLIKTMVETVTKMLPEIVKAQLDKNHPKDGGAVRSHQQPQNQPATSRQRQPRNFGNGANQNSNTGRSYSSVVREGNSPQQFYNNHQQQQRFQEPWRQQQQPYNNNNNFNQHNNNYNYQQQQHQQNPQFTTYQNSTFQNRSYNSWTRDQGLQSDNQGWRTRNFWRQQPQQSGEQPSRTSSVAQQQNSRFVQQQQTQPGFQERTATNHSRN